MGQVALLQSDPPQLMGPLVESRCPPARRRWRPVPCQCLRGLQALPVRLRYPQVDLIRAKGQDWHFPLARLTVRWGLVASSPWRVARRRQVRVGACLWRRPRALRVVLSSCPPGLARRKQAVMWLCLVGMQHRWLGTWRSPWVRAAMRAGSGAPCRWVLATLEQEEKGAVWSWLPGTGSLAVMWRWPPGQGR